MHNYQSKCYRYYGPGEVKTETMDITCGPEDIVIKIDVCGRCGTDRRLFTNAHPNVKTPTVLGHELVGKVVEVGNKVKHLTSGIGYKAAATLQEAELCPETNQRVTVQSRIARYKNGLMLIRDPIQNLSFQIPGAYAQYMKISKEMIQSGAILTVSDEISDEEAALVEPAACALESIYASPHAVGVDEEGRHIIHSGILPGGKTLIIGSGTLAMIYAQLAKIEGADEIWVFVRSPAKAELCKTVLGEWVKIKIIEDYSSLPLSEKLNVEKNLVAEFADLTHGDLFDDIVLAAPSLDAQRYMFNLLNPDGYGVTACFAGMHEAGENVEVDLLHYRMGKAIGTSGCSTKTMETILKWLGDGKLSLKGFTCPKHYTLNDDPEVFFTTKADGRKPMLYPWE